MDYNYNNAPQQGFDPQMPPVPASYSFTQAIQRAFNNYCNFSGRATVSEYWWFVLFTFLGALILSLISEYLGYIFQIAVLLPSLGLAWRRMHDIGRGGGWYFINLIPVVGWIIWIVWCCKPSEPFNNRFGAFPEQTFYN